MARFLFPVPEGDPEQDLRSRSLHFVILVYGVLALVVATLLLARGRIDRFDQARSWLMILGVVAAFLLYRGRNYTGAALLTILSSSFTVATGAWFYGGVYSISFALGGAALVVTAGTFFGAAGSGFSVVSLLLFGVTSVVWGTESVIPRPKPSQYLVMEGTILLYITAIASYQNTLLRRYQRLTMEGARERQADLERMLAADWRLQVTLDGAEVGTWEWREDGAFAFSPNVPRLCRWQGSDFPGDLKGLLASVSREHRAAFEEVFLNPGTGKDEPFQVEMEMRVPGGGRTWLEWRGQRRSRGEDEAAVFLGTLQNVDGRKRVEARLTESEGRWRELLLGWSGGVLQFGERGEMAHANPAALRLLALSHGQLTGEAKVPDAWRCLTESGERVHDLTAYFSVRRASAETHLLAIWPGQGSGPTWVLCRMVPGKDPVGFLVEMTDVTKLHRAETAMRQNEDRWRETLRGIPDRIVQVDRGGHLLFSNRSHWPRAGEKWDAHVPEGERGRLGEILGRVFDGGDGEDLDLTLNPGDLPSAIRVIPVKWEGMVVSLLLMIREGRHGELARRQGDRRILEFIAKSPTLMYLKSGTGMVLFANGAFERFFNLEPGGWQGKEDLEILGSSLYEKVHRLDREVLTEGGSRTTTVSYEDDLETRDLIVTRFALDHGGEPVVAAVGTEVTNLNRAHRELQQAEARLRALADHAAVGIVECDLEQRLLSANPAFCQMVEKSLPSLMGQVLPRLLPQGDWRRFEGLVWDQPPSPEPAMLRWRTPGGDFRHLHHVWSLVHDGDGKPWRLVHVFQDVSEREEARERLAYLAHFDPLTGLHNRRRLGEQLETALADGEPRALILLNLERFRELNDNLGPSVGDRVLVEVASRLKQLALSHGAFLARSSGDEFALLTGSTNGKGVETWIKALDDRLGAPIEIDGLKLNIQARMGVALTPEHGRDAKTLWRSADGALGVGRKNREGVTFFDPVFLRDLPRRQVLLGDMEQHIRNRKLSVVYQPKVRLSDGKPMGMEVLCRWHHPELGPVSPAEFIPLAEAAHRITDLTLAVLDLSLAQATLWRGSGYRTPLAVNLSPRCLNDRFFLGRFQEILTQHRVAPGDLELEITESAFLEDPDRAREILEDLERQGIPLSLDDFGTGYAAMIHLVDLPLRNLKIDASFVRRLTHSTRHGTLVTSTIDLAHRLGFEVIGEGVEDAETAKTLQALGCDQAQGWYFSRPMVGSAVDPAIWLTPTHPHG